MASDYYINISKSMVVAELKDTVDNRSSINQEQSSLCGPASFFYVLFLLSPDVYVRAVIDLFTHGKAKISNLSLQSSTDAANYSPSRMRHSDWMLLSSIKPSYDEPSEKFDGITLPKRLRKWFLKSGFTIAKDNTSVFFKKGIDDLLKAQKDYDNGYTIILFVDLNILNPFKQKSCGSLFPNHWITLTSDINLCMYNEATRTLSPPEVINKRLVNEINQSTQVEMPENGFPTISPTNKFKKAKTKLSVFTWGNDEMPIESTLPCFLERFYGYLKVKM
jgi:hypothetical protein